MTCDIRAHVMYDMQTYVTDNGYTHIHVYVTSPSLYQTLVSSLIQDRINSLPLSGPHRLSSNDLLCSILWHVSCLLRDRTGSSGTFYLPFDLRQMHVPDAYFGNAHSVLSVLGKVYRISSSWGLRDDTNFRETFLL